MENKVTADYLDEDVYKRQYLYCADLCSHVYDPKCI